MTGLLILKQTFATSNILKQKKRENAEMESTQTGILETERQKNSQTVLVQVHADLHLIDLVQT